MKMIDSLKKYLFLPALAILFCLFFSVNTKAATTGKAYITVEKFTIGQGFLVEPYEVTFTEGETVAQISDRVLKERGYSMILKTGSWYVEGIKNADSGKSAIPECIKSEWGLTDKVESDKDLCEFDYNVNSGWTYYVNNSSPNCLSDKQVVKNGDVIRWRFTVATGDLGGDRLSLPNMDTLIKAMAIFNANKQLCTEKGYQGAYNEALSFITNMDAYYIDDTLSGHTQKEIEAKIQTLSGKLPSEASINQWKAEKAAAEKAAAAAKEAAAKAAAAKAAAAKKILKYTPSAPQWKSLTSKKTRTATLTWKKNSKATGYEIYMSTKKSSGYKKIATVKGYKKITYTKKSLKKKKTYYFKLRAYKTVGKTKYRSAYSKVKKIKVK